MEHCFKWPSKEQQAKEKSLRMGEYRTYRAQKGFWKSEAGQHQDVQQQRLNQSYVDRQPHLSSQNKMHRRYLVGALAENSLDDS